MKKNILIALMAVLTFTMLSCQKDADVVAIEAKLPALQLSSLGYQQAGPFTVPTTVLQLSFGATATNTPVGAFKIEVFTGTAATGTPLRVVNFPSWSGKDDSVLSGTTPNGPHSISFTLSDSTYPGTNVYAGTILLKLSSLGVVANGTYTVRATASSADGTKTSVFTQTSFFKTI